MEARSRFLMEVFNMYNNGNGKYFLRLEVQYSTCAVDLAHIL